MRSAFPVVFLRAAARRVALVLVTLLAAGLVSCGGGSSPRVRKTGHNGKYGGASASSHARPQVSSAPSASISRAATLASVPLAVVPPPRSQCVMRGKQCNILSLVMHRILPRPDRGHGTRPFPTAAACEKVLGERRAAAPRSRTLPRGGNTVQAVVIGQREDLHAVRNGHPGDDLGRKGAVGGGRARPGLPDRISGRIRSGVQNRRGHSTGSL